MHFLQPLVFGRRGSEGMTDEGSPLIALSHIDIIELPHAAEDDIHKR